MLSDLGDSFLILNRPLPEAQVPPQLGGACANTWQLLEQAPGRAAHCALVGLALPGLLPRAVHLFVCPAGEEDMAMSPDAGSFAFTILYAFISAPGRAPCQTPHVSCSFDSRT